MYKATLFVAGLLAGLVLAVAAATADSGGINRSCRDAVAGFEGWCADPVGDVKGVPGPDIARVTVLQWEIIVFRVNLAMGSRLAHSAAFTDKVSVFLTASGFLNKPPRHYVLTFSAAHPRQTTLRRLPNGKRIVLTGPTGPMPGGGWTKGSVVYLHVNLHKLGNPGTVRYRVQAARVMRDGSPGSSDYAPNKGTGAWHQ